MDKRMQVYRRVLGALSKEQRRALKSNPEMKDRVMAIAEENIARQALAERRYFGRVALQAIWNIYKNGWHVLYLGEHETLSAWAEERLLYDENGEELASKKHLQAMVRIVERILQPVYQALSEGNPFVHPDTGEVITPEMLIHEPNLQEKMRLLSNRFSSTNNHEEQQEILNRIFTETKASIEASIKEDIRNNGFFFKWSRQDRGEEDIVYVIIVPRQYSMAIESILSKNGEQTFEEAKWLLTTTESRG